ncbi:hypothetical protein JZ751_007143 [Albula glossodonta]|uniref:Uncharacterized protein n=1 Tax=Albula glossodonta TaxID=121402 RepID=A0A8T2PAZ0_9TELE|nr:hypothetical protein JZ751_007143 [Albula glossodonta]
MRQSKRMRSPGGWLSEYSWEERWEERKRQKRGSHSSERENKPKRHHHHYRTYEGHYLETRSLNRRPEYKERRGHEASMDLAGCGEGGHGTNCQERGRERDWHHYSKSSGRSGRSRRSSHGRYRGRRHSPSRHRSDSV